MHAPTLDLAIITHQLARMYAGGQKHRSLIAVHGRCDDPRPIVLPGVGRFAVVLVDSELDLRRLLHEPSHGEPTPTVYLVPWLEHLPLDVAGRFAHDGRVFRVDAEVRLSRLFTDPFETIDPDVLTSKLAAWLLQEPPQAPLPSPGGRLTLRALWNTWLRTTWGIDLDESGPGGFLAWAASNGHGPRLAQALESAAAAGVQTELEATLGRRFGEPAPAIFNAWLQERGTPLLGFAILCETLVPRSHEDRALRTWLALKAAPFLGPRVHANQCHRLLQRLAELVPPTLAELARAQQRVALRAALEAADTLADEHVRAALIDSPRLLSSWQQRLAALGRLLKDAAPAPAHATLDRAVLALRALEQHDRPRYSRDGRAAAELARAEAGVRLLAWLLARTDPPAAHSMHPGERAEQLARWYIDEGSYLDRVRQAARGASTDPFGIGVTTLLARVEDERAQLDRQFAESLATVPHGRNPGQTIALADALERIAVRFLEDGSDRRVLVVLLADMAWRQAIDLLASLDDDASRWAPLAWHGLHGSRSDTVPCPVVLGTIPSIAPLGRSALLSGRPAPPGVLPTTGDDALRIAEHRGLARLHAGSAPALFLRHALDASVGSDVLAQIRDPRARLVTVVLDAIDASLVEDTHTASPWRARTIRPLFELLDAAQAAGRAVLLTTDHGHISADRLERTEETTPRGGARWRPWMPGATVSPHETPFLAEHAWAPRGAQGVLVIHDERHRHDTTSTQAREHGGATLAEVVTPMFLLGWEGMDSELDDPELALKAATPPRWWHLHLEPPPVRPPRESRRPRPVRNDPQPQLTLLALTPDPPPPAADGGYQPLTRQLLASPIFAVRAAEPRQREQTILAIEVLLRHGAAASEDILGPALGIAARRVGGFIVKASEILNVDGYAVLAYDPIARRAELHLERLLHCFELTRA